MDSSEGGLELTAIGDARLLGVLGEGVSCTCYSAEWRGREVALKVYKAGAVERHARLTGRELAEYEFHRCRAFHRVPELSRYVAEPLAYLCTGGVSAFVQERLVGPLYCRYRADDADPRTAGAAASANRLFAHVERIVALAHSAGLYDMDLHAANLIVVDDPTSGEPIPKLFDFNFIPFYEHPPNPWVWLMLKVGVIDRRWRDLRKLRAFHDYRRIEHKLAVLQEAREGVNG